MDFHVAISLQHVSIDVLIFGYLFKATTLRSLIMTLLNLDVSLLALQEILRPRQQMRAFMSMWRMDIRIQPYVIRSGFYGIYRLGHIAINSVLYGSNTLKKKSELKIDLQKYNQTSVFVNRWQWPALRMPASKKISIAGIPNGSFWFFKNVNCRHSQRRFLIFKKFQWPAHQTPASDLLKIQIAGIPNTGF